jgi:CHAT domain-containing protein
MKRAAFMALALCSLASACGKDTERAVGWRSVEPRLSGADAWQRCCRPETAPPSRPSPCPEVFTTPEQAILLLRVNWSCTEEAIGVLQRDAEIHRETWSDVAAAHYLRAQRDNAPAELLQAEQAGGRAVTATPQRPAAWFNLALAQEALGWREEAIGSWQQVRHLDHSSWSDEALSHLSKLQQTATADRQWAAILPQLSPALASDDVAAVTRLVDPFPLSAETYLEGELLPQWAESPSKETLAQAKTLATALSRRSGDPFPADVVAAIESARSAEKIAALRKGHQQYAGKNKAAAAESLNRGGSPLRLLADLRHAVDVSRDSCSAALALLDQIEQQAQPHRYAHLVARVRATRANCLLNQSDYLKSLAEYDAALDTFRRLRDRESEARIRIRKMGIYRMMGDFEEVLREARTIREAGLPIVSYDQRHLLNGELSQTALALKSPQAALRYQRLILQDVRSELAATPPEEKLAIDDIQLNLIIALREVAGIEFHVGQYARAKMDLEEAKRLARLREDKDANSIRQALEERLSLVQGEMLLDSNPAAAASAFTRTLELAKEENHSFRATAFIRRAEALRRSKHPAEAGQDLRLALREVRIEEAKILSSREPGRDDPFWYSYFDRFEETYRALIGQLVDEGKIDEAFLYAENSRAYEPLNLILQSDVAPEAFRQLTPLGDAIPIDQVQRHLPPGTVLIEYSVLDERTCVWIVWHEDHTFVALPVRRSEIERWTADLQKAARERNEQAFERGLEAPYHALIAEPLRRAGGNPNRLVIIPDGDLHGLPFAALRDRASGHHLTQQADLTIDGSATLYLFSLLRDRDLPVSRKASPLLIGDPAFDPILGYPRLPAARDEVDQIRNIYGRGDVLKDLEPTAAELLRRAGAADIIHFAGHSIAVPRAPWQSRLLLAASGTDSGELTAQELLTQLAPGPTRLTVLSSCTSAGGFPVGAQGIGPLVRPFLVRGVPAVVGSLWDVRDATAKDLLVSFHRAYRKGSDAAAALRAAQLEAIGRNRNNVLSWAAFEVIGHASSPFAPAQAKKENPP